MNLNLTNQLFIIGGASSGLGNAVARALLAEGAKVIAVARSEEKLKSLKNEFPSNVETVAADITAEGTASRIIAVIGNRPLHGLLVNAGGPPAKTVLETTVNDWDDAYRSVLRWKVELIQAVMPFMRMQRYGRVLFIESASVKQPMENLVLSNAFRLAAVGFMKTISQELAAEGITFNALAPGFHNTAALDRLINKKVEQAGVTREEAKDQFAKESKVGFLGNPADFGSLAAWLLSESSRYITGQTISVDGGVIKGVMG